VGGKKAKGETKMKTIRTFIEGPDGEVMAINLFLDKDDLYDPAVVEAYFRKTGPDFALRMLMPDGNEYVLDADVMVAMMDAIPDQKQDDGQILEYIQRLDIQPEPDRQLPGPRCFMFVDCPAYAEVVRELPSFKPRWIEGILVPCDYVGRGAVVATADGLKRELARQDLSPVIRIMLQTYRRLDPNDVRIIRD
jgi:hypothetical protein